MRLSLPELQQMAQIRAEELQQGWEDIDGVLHPQGLPFMPEVIRMKLINRHHDHPLAGHFSFDETHCSEVLLAEPPKRR